CVGDSLLETLDNVRDCAPQPPSGLNRLVDRDLETICLKCLEKEPERRYGSAEALARDLERWLAGPPIKARPGSRLERAGGRGQGGGGGGGGVVAGAPGAGRGGGGRRRPAPGCDLQGLRGGSGAGRPAGEGGAAQQRLRRPGRGQPGPVGTGTAQPAGGAD